MIEARSITYRVGGVTLLSDVSISIGAGEVVALVGPNGAGKSTLLQILAGDLAPTQGDLLFAGRALSSEWKVQRALLEQQADLALSLSSSSSYLSSYAAVLLGRNEQQPEWLNQKDDVVARLAMAATNPQSLEARSFATLSHGERQRVEAARAFAQVWDGPSGRVLLLDEPTRSLDVAHQHSMLRLAQRMADDRCAVVCIVHDLNLAAQYATRVVVMRNGHIHSDGRPSRVLSAELLAEVFKVEALVVPHPDPELACPMVIVLGPLPQSATSVGRGEPRLSRPAGVHEAGGIL